MLELTDDNMKYVALSVGAVAVIYMLYKSQEMNKRIVEGLTNNSSNYQKTLEKLPNRVKSLRTMLNISTSRNDIEDILTKLSEMVDLAQLNTLLNYANSPMDEKSTNKIAVDMRSFNEIERSIKSSISYLDSI
jgi:ABC-type anion transport system duplicated permease subunit